MTQSYGEYYISHSGIKGMKWGIRRYQNEDGSLTPEGIERYRRKEKRDKALGKVSSAAARVGAASMLGAFATGAASMTNPSLLPLAMALGGAGAGGAIIGTVADVLRTPVKDLVNPQGFWTGNDVYGQNYAIWKTTVNSISADDMTASKYGKIKIKTSR